MRSNVSEMVLPLQQKRMKKDNRMWRCILHVELKKKGKKIMKKIVSRILDSKKFNKYCVNVMKMYNIGRVNMPL